MTIFHESARNSASAAGSVSAGPVSVGRFVASIAGNALSRGGTVMAELLAKWPAIAGPALAVYATPAKLTKVAQAQGFTSKNASSLLVLKVEPAKALDVQYAVPQLIERINQAFGFKAVSELRILQAPVSKKASPATASRTQPAAELLDGRNASRLDAALARMSAGVKARGFRP